MVWKRLGAARKWRREKAGWAAGRPRHPQGSELERVLSFSSWEGNLV